MDREVELRSEQVCQRWGSERRVAKLMLEEKIDDGFRELVGLSGSRALRDQARQTSAVEECLGLIEDGARKPKPPNGLGDRCPVDLNTAKHLVLDLH